MHYMGPPGILVGTPGNLGSGGSPHVCRSLSEASLGLALANNNNNNNNKFYSYSRYIEKRTVTVQFHLQGKKIALIYIAVVIHILNI